MYKRYKRLERFGLSLYVVRVTLAASLSWLIVRMLGSDEFSYFAPLAAILITQSNVRGSFEKGLYRLLGIVLGGAVSLLVGYFLEIGFFSLLLALVIGLSAGTAFRMNANTIPQIGVTAVLVLAFYQTDDYVAWRIFETLTGVVIALLINIIIVPPDSFNTAKRSAQKACHALAEALLTLSTKQEEMKAAKAFLQEADRQCLISKQAEKDLEYTISYYKCRENLNRLELTIAHIEKIHDQMTQIAAELSQGRMDSHIRLYSRHVLELTAECISQYSEVALSPNIEAHIQFQKSVKRARDTQLLYFSYLHHQTTIPIIRDMGAVFSHLNHLLDELEDTQPLSSSLLLENQERMFFKKARQLV
ncbi:MAG TPA: FUSC family protein [Bacillus sp. (in: firmicutes)]|nr:FUSC family protein [Bacillus sp. (in: firmicutes)]